MSRVYQAGTLNTTALVVPDLYVQIAQPQSLALSGVSSSVMGVVGTASWGPVGKPLVCGGMGDYVLAFGPKQALPTDAGMAVDIAMQQGARDFRIVRVTDGQDRAATATLDGVSVTAVHTGSAGNAISIGVSATSNGYALVVSHALMGVRAYTGSDWVTLSTAIRADASALVIVELPDAVPALQVAHVVLAGGMDGGVPETVAFLGTDNVAWSGMYALRGQGCTVAVLAGLTDSASLTTQAAFGLSEGVYMIAAGQAGQLLEDAIAAKIGAGIDSYALKLMFGDWIWWSDDTNGLTLVSPQAFVAGKLAALSPERSSLNKALSGIVGTQKAGLAGGSTTYSSAELEALFESGIDVICNPSPGGAYWAVRCGHNTSSSVTTRGDHYTRLTNYLSASLAGGMGSYVGSVINDSLFGDIRATLLGFLSSLVSQGILGVTGGQLPYAVVCDASNNPQVRIASGYVQADVQVQYQGINEKFIINLQGGSTVVVSSSAGSV